MSSEVWNSYGFGSPLMVCALTISTLVRRAAWADTRAGVLVLPDPDPPTPMETASAFCQHRVGWPRAVLIAPSRQHWDIFVGLCTDIQGPLVSDAYPAALAIEHACELVTTDSAFARFKGLRWRHPLRA